MQVLNVDSNQLSSLPVQLSSLQKLENLQCSKNLLTTLPSSLGQLPRLKLLNCSSNKIAKLPEELQASFSLRLETTESSKVHQYLCANTRDDTDSLVKSAAILFIWQNCQTARSRRIAKLFGIHSIIF